ncbi:hypothetical protein BT69DRAFT_872054 [Atractiella rhizophila]|nr:hypothetical protein BT69DRAFT_872054 [Atractiella rhizophila]
MRFFNALEDKDAFLAYHARFYIRRVVKGQSISHEEEDRLVNTLSTVGETRKLSQLVRDSKVSEDLTSTFQNRQKGLSILASPSEWNTSPIVRMTGLSMHVFSSWTYALKQCEWQLVLPPELLETCQAFTAFYKTKFNNRTLLWQWNVSAVELQTLYTKGKKYLYSLSLLQATILLQFNNESTTTFSRAEVKDKIGMNRNSEGENESVETALDRLVNARVLILTEDNYKLNLDARFKNVKVQLDRAIKAPAGNGKEKEVQKEKNDDDDVEEAIWRDRSLTIQASIVRSMKKHQTMEYQALVLETIESLKDRFRPQPKDIKRALETLLEKEYVERTKVNGTRDGYKVCCYVAIPLTTACSDSDNSTLRSV